MNIDRFSPLPLRGGKELPNRLVVPPMASGTADENGFVTGTTLAHYARLAEAGPGLLMVEYTYVHPSGKSEDNQLGAWDDAQIDGLGQLADTIVAAGAIAGLQLTHSGGKSDRKTAGGRLMGPSGVAVPVKDEELEAPDVMTAEDIALWQNSFALAIDRAVAAGFDLVELHSAHGYGLNQWLSPITNRRDDGYGGDLTGRMRLLLEIIAAAKARHPGLLFSVRIPGQDFYPGGLSADDGIAVARRLEGAGVDIVNVSSGIGGWRRPRERNGEGYLVDEAARIQKAVRIPVIGVGGIESGTYIDAALRGGDMSLAAVGRAILKGPREWAQANMRAHSRRPSGGEFAATSGESGLAFSAANP